MSSHVSGGAATEWMNQGEHNVLPGWLLKHMCCSMCTAMENGLGWGWGILGAKALGLKTHLGPLKGHRHHLDRAGLLSSEMLCVLLFVSECTVFVGVFKVTFGTFQSMVLLEGFTYSHLHKSDRNPFSYEWANQSIMTQQSRTLKQKSACYVL